MPPTITAMRSSGHSEAEKLPTQRSLRSDILFSIGIVILLYVCWKARDVILLVYVSALFAVVLSPAIEAIREIHIGHWWPGRGTAIVFIIVLALTAVSIFVVFALPPIFNDSQNFSKELPRKIAAASDALGHVPYMGKVDPNTLNDRIDGAIGGAFGLFKSVFGFLFALFSWIILTAYFILDGQRAFYWFLSFLAEPQRGRLRTTMLRAEKRVRHWLTGQAVLMLLLGFTSGIAFWLMHVRYAVALAVLAGTLNIVPVLGPIAGFAMAGTVAAFDSWTKFLGVGAFYFLYHQFENAVLTPKIMKYSVDLPALAVIVALTLGFALAGIIGALIAVPTAAIVAVILDDYLVKFRGPGGEHTHHEHVPIEPETEALSQAE